MTGKAGLPLMAPDLVEMIVTDLMMTTAKKRQRKSEILGLDQGKRSTIQDPVQEMLMILRETSTEAQGPGQGKPDGVQGPGQGKSRIQDMGQGK